MDTKTLTFGGRDFAVAPFTLDQLSRMSGLFSVATPFSTEGVNAARDLIALAVKDQATVAEIAATATSLDEIQQATDMIAEVSGMVPLLERLRAKQAAAAAQ